MPLHERDCTYPKNKNMFYWIQDFSIELQKELGSVHEHGQNARPSEKLFSIDAGSMRRQDLKNKVVDLVVTGIASRQRSGVGKKLRPLISLINFYKINILNKKESQQHNLNHKIYKITMCSMQCIKLNQQEVI